MSEQTAPGDRTAPATAPVVLVGLMLVVVSVTVDLAWVLVPWTAAPEPPFDATAGVDPTVIETSRGVAASLRLPALLSLGTGVLALAAVVLSGPGRRLLGVLRRVRGGVPVQVAAQVLLALVVVMLVQWPFGVWAELVRRDAGLSVQDWTGWTRDRLVNSGFEAVTLTGVVVMVVLLARALPRWWPAAVAAVAGVVVVVLSLLYPVVVEPALADLEPLPAGTVRTQVEEVAVRAGAPVADVLVSDAASRTTTLNAYVSGLGPTRRMVLQDTLLSAMPEEQVLAVVAHETAHAASRDVLRGTVLAALAVSSVALLGGVVAMTVAARRARWRRGVGEVSAAGVVLLLVVLLQQVAVPVTSLISRQVERAADVRAVELTRDPSTYAEAMRSLVIANQADPSPPGAFQWWFGSHPTAAERVAVAERADVVDRR